MRLCQLSCPLILYDIADMNSPPNPEIHMRVQEVKTVQLMSNDDGVCVFSKLTRDTRQNAHLD